MAIESVNPATGERLRTYAAMSPDELRAAVAACAAAQRAWARTDVAERARPLRAAARILREEVDALARLAALEMGKPLAQGRAEVEKCATNCEFYADHGARFLAREPVATEASKSFVCFEPLGVVLAVMPWNFPYWQVMRFAAPALVAGNGALLKHASNVTGCALALEDVWRRAGLPAGLFRTLVVGSDGVAGLIEQPGVAAVTLTGSTPAGRAVASKAGSVLKKQVLELGGSDAYVILEDADLERAVETCVASRLINGGQSCIAAKRFVIHESHRAAAERLFVEKMRARRVGDPLADGVDVGPLARRDLRDEVHEQVERSVAKGARLLVGGEKPPGPGAFYPPTVLTDVRPGMPAYDDELFGPVAALVFAPDEEDAIRVANDSPFGLGAAVFTRDVARGEEIAARRLEAGSCFVNAFVRSDPRLPFGGIKESGYGRELGVFGVREFVNVKTVWVD
ncbi:MAG TPA: NAD-dependent succinate-semialdehyde dehydrogenase [Myxococcota bacterium]|nr:NAD-dependent succinate-semialdehyde dehydrogenase [Myxococcota bacterium]